LVTSGRIARKTTIAIELISEDLSISGVPPNRIQAGHQGPIRKPTEIFDYYDIRHNGDNDVQS